MSGATQRFDQKEKKVIQMKATVIHEFGDFDTLKHEDIERPSPKPGHVLIKVLAAGVERLDHYIREGSIVPELPFPHILGADAAGEVADLGEGVTGFEIGERVIVAPGYPQKEDETHIRPTVTAPSFALPGLHISGTYTQYMEVPAYAVVKDNTGLEPEEVATLPVVLATAVHSIKQIGAAGLFEQKVTVLDIFDYNRVVKKVHTYIQMMHYCSAL